MAWWNSKNDREHLLEIREEIMRLMKNKIYHAN